MIRGGKESVPSALVVFVLAVLVPSAVSTIPPATATTSGLGVSTKQLAQAFPRFTVLREAIAGEPATTFVTKGHLIRAFGPASNVTLVFYIVDLDQTPELYPNYALRLTRIIIPAWLLKEAADFYELAFRHLAKERREGAGVYETRHGVKVTVQVYPSKRIVTTTFTSAK